jgi:Na+/melibiose symporter-like transporter
MFGAIYGWAMKASFALSFVMIGLFLNAIGFNPAVESQSPQTYFNMRLAMCLGAGGPAILCFVLLRFYPLTKEHAEANRRTLERLRAGV